MEANDKESNLPKSQGYGEISALTALTLRVLLLLDCACYAIYSANAHRWI